MAGDKIKLNLSSNKHVLHKYLQVMKPLKTLRRDSTFQ